MLVDYDAVTRAGIASMLASGAMAEVVGVADGVDDFHQKFQTHAPDVIITNVQNHSGVDAVEITRLVKLANPKVPVIVLAEDERHPFAISAVQAGISAYILRKTVSTEVLESVIQTVIKTGSAVLSAYLMKTVVASLTKNANTALSYSSDGEIQDLTPRELDVLRLMASGSPNQEIGEMLGISHETTRKHVSRIVDKLGARNRTHASIIANNAAISGDGYSPGGDCYRAKVRREVITGANGCVAAPSGHGGPPRVASGCWTPTSRTA
jgi:DNA-binding NarL/FixJ family response regulator